MVEHIKQVILQIGLPLLFLNLRMISSLTSDEKNLIPTTVRPVRESRISRATVVFLKAQPTPGLLRPFGHRNSKARSWTSRQTAQQFVALRDCIQKRSNLLIHAPKPPATVREIRNGSDVFVCPIDPTFRYAVLAAQIERQVKQDQVMANWKLRPSLPISNR